MWGEVYTNGVQNDTSNAHLSESKSSKWMAGIRPKLFARRRQEQLKNETERKKLRKKNDEEEDKAKEVITEIWHKSHYFWLAGTVRTCRVRRMTMTMILPLVLAPPIHTAHTHSHTGIRVGQTILIHRITSRNSFHGHPVFALLCIDELCARCHADVLCRHRFHYAKLIGISCVRQKKTLNCAKCYNKSPSIDAKIYFTLNANAHGTSHRCNVMPCAVRTALLLYASNGISQKEHLRARRMGHSNFSFRCSLLFPVSLHFMICHLSSTKNKFSNMIQSPF